MSGMYFKKFAGLGLALGLALGTASAAEAATTYNVSWAMDTNSGFGTAEVHYTPTNPDIDVNAYVGRIILSGTDSNGTAFSFKSFCVDVVDDLANGTFTGAAATASALSLTSPKLAQLTSILSNADSFIGNTSTPTDNLGGTSADRSAAIQMAIWEVLYDVSYDTTTGNVYEDHVSGKAVQEAAAVISNINSGTWTTSAGFKIALVQSAGNQTQVVYGSDALRVLAGVPEPATWGMMVLGFGALGAALRRSKRDTASVIA